MIEMNNYGCPLLCLVWERNREVSVDFLIVKLLYYPCQVKYKMKTKKKRKEIGNIVLHDRVRAPS